jgi:hypothetical protein
MEGKKKPRLTNGWTKLVYGVWSSCCRHRKRCRHSCLAYTGASGLHASAWRRLHGAGGLHASACRRVHAAAGMIGPRGNRALCAGG